MPYLALRFDATAGDADALGGRAARRRRAVGRCRRCAAPARRRGALLRRARRRVAVVAGHAPHRAVRRVRRRRGRRSRASASDIGLPTPDASRSRRSPTTTGCAQTQAQFAPMQASPRIWIVPSWCEPVATRCDQPAHRSGPRVRHRQPCDDAPVPALARRASRARARACSTTAADPAFWRSPRRSWAPAIACGVDVDAQAIVASRANAAANGVERVVRLARRVARRHLRRRRREHSRQSAGTARAAARGDACARAATSCCPACSRRRRRRSARRMRDGLHIDVWGSEDGWVALAGRRKRDHG